MLNYMLQRLNNLRVKDLVLLRSSRPSTTVIELSLLLKRLFKFCCTFVFMEWLADINRGSSVADGRVR